jgi:hypothetical protein
VAPALRRVGRERRAAAFLSPSGARPAGLHLDELRVASAAIATTRSQTGVRFARWRAGDGMFFLFFPPKYKNKLRTK